LQHGQDLVHDQPLVQMLEQLPNADQSVDSYGKQTEKLKIVIFETDGIIFLSSK
jgi:hypothetical protein